MKNSVKTFLALGIITAVGAGGTAMIASARGDSPADSPTTASEAHIVQAGDRKISKGSKNEANEGPDNEAENASDQEMYQYQALATVTPEQAQQTAEAAQGERATKVELDEDNSSLVYRVDFAKAEVLVDAGNGKILKTEIAGQEEDDAIETPVQGSIQVPEGAGERDET